MGNVLHFETRHREKRVSSPAFSNNFHVLKNRAIIAENMVLGFNVARQIKRCILHWEKIDKVWACHTRDVIPQYE